MSYPQRFPSPLGRTTIDAQGVRHPVMEEPFIECGQLATLRGVGLVVCVRRKGHPVAINYGHTNGYEEWCFNEAES